MNYGAFFTETAQKSDKSIKEAGPVIFHGIVKDGRVELAAAVSVPDGTVVTVFLNEPVDFNAASCDVELAQPSLSGAIVANGPAPAKTTSQEDWPEFVRTMAGIIDDPTFCRPSQGVLPPPVELD